jgi:ubiquinone/menaquinone biosynthesis C-methylase UbiE
MLRIIIMGIIKRLLLELKYIRQTKWTYKEVGAHWDSIAVYDKINEGAYSYFQRFTKAFRLCTLPDKSYILDICSRTGKGTEYFFENNKIKSAVCADVAKNMQEICRRRLAGVGVDFITVLFESLPLPFKDSEFGGILCFETIEHMPDPAQFLKELSRILKKNGELILTTPNRLWQPIHWIAAVFGWHHSEGPCSFLNRNFIVRTARSVGLSVSREESSVLLPFNSKWSIKLNIILEKILPKSLLGLIALRRIFIFLKAI